MNNTFNENPVHYIGFCWKQQNPMQCIGFWLKVLFIYLKKYIIFNQRKKKKRTFKPKSDALHKIWLKRPFSFSLFFFWIERFWVSDHFYFLPKYISFFLKSLTRKRGCRGIEHRDVFGGIDQNTFNSSRNSEYTHLEREFAGRYKEIAHRMFKIGF